MSEATKKVSLIFAVEGGAQAAAAFGRVGDGAKSAAREVANLATTLRAAANGATGGDPSRPPMNPLEAMIRSGGGTPTQSGYMDVSRLSRPASAMDMALLGRHARDQRYAEANRLSPYHAPDSSQLPDDVRTFSERNYAARRWGQTAVNGLAGVGKGLDAANAGLARFAGRAIIPLAIAQQAAEGAGAFHSEQLVKYQGGSEGEQARAAANGMWLSRQALGIADTFRGRTQQFGRAEYDAQFEKVRREGEERSRQEQNQIRLQRMEYEARSATLNADRRVATPGVFDRGTVGGERAFREDTATIGARQGVLDAEKERAALERLQASQEGMKRDLQVRLGQLQTEAGRYYNEAQATGGVDKYVAQNKEGYRLTAVQDALKELRDLEGKIEDTKARAVAAGAQVGQSRLGVMQSQLGVLEGRESQAAGTARRLGSMTATEFQMAQQAARLVEAHGIDNVPRPTLELARPLIPQYVEKLEEKRGATRYDQNKDFFGGFGEHQYGLNDVRGEIDELRKIIANANEAVKRGAADDAAIKLAGEEFAKTMMRYSNQGTIAGLRESKRAVEQSNTRGTR
ncbi:hypothetical protein [Limnoglobus roseus]|uniref:Uncharacterized protein n=1 Tax=Limnoglobus roseus TaxID=2598579 RepID=A0A5C1AGI9_9BACT|nr:hypothetical protein [Limnoglobus roseus]QEL18321.1 hypothetical protein PX52LOC_05342 [Limnoglobus roseus]